jgi:hypothetical protein
MIMKEGYDLSITEDCSAGIPGDVDWAGPTDFKSEVADFI